MVIFLHLHLVEILKINNQSIIRLFSHCDAGKQINMNLISLKCSLSDALSYLVSPWGKVLYSTGGRLLYRLQGLSFSILGIRARSCKFLYVSLTLQWYQVPCSSVGILPWTKSSVYRSVYTPERSYWYRWL